MTKNSCMKLIKTNNLAVNTQHGQTKRRKAQNNICQGDAWESIQCSVQMDGIGRESLEQE